MINFDLGTHLQSCDILRNRALFCHVHFNYSTFFHFRPGRSSFLVHQNDCNDHNYYTSELWSNVYPEMLIFRENCETLIFDKSVAMEKSALLRFYQKVSNVGHKLLQSSNIHVAICITDILFWYDNHQE